MSDNLNNTKKRSFYRIIFVISILLNLILLTYFFKKTASCYSDRKNKRMEHLSVIAKRDSLLVDKNILYSDSTAILFTFGQSNAANYGQGFYIPHKQVFNYFNGNLYTAKEPLLGASGPGCSVWTRLADMLIDSGLYNKVVLIPIGIDGASIDCWVNGICNNNLQETLTHIEKDSIRVTHVIWHQGETDAVENTPKHIYKEKLKKILMQLRAHRITSTFYVCIASYQPSNINKLNGVDTLIQNAQIEFVKENEGAKLGVNTDLFNLVADRYDGIHFSKSGLDKFAKALFEAIKK